MSKLTTTENGETDEEQSQEHCSSFSLTSRKLFTKNSSSQAKQSIPHPTVTFYGDCVKMCEHFAPNFADKRTGCCSHQPYFSLFLRLKIKLKGHHFGTSEVIEAKSQAVLNAFTEHDFQDTMKK
jgi:hypothetical protein